MSKKSNEILAQLKEEYYALSYDHKSLRIILRFHVDLCFEHWRPPKIIEKKTKEKLESLEYHGRLDYSFTHFKKLKTIWKMIRREEYYPSDNMVRMTIAHGAKDMKELKINETELYNSIAELEIEYSPKVKNLGFAAFRSIVYLRLIQSKISDRPSDACLRYIHLKIREERKNNKFLLFSVNENEFYRGYIQKHSYYNYFYLLIREMEDNERIFGLIVEEIEKKVGGSIQSSTVRNFAEDYHHIKRYLFNKPTAFGINLPFDFLIAYGDKGDKTLRMLSREDLAPEKDLTKDVKLTTESEEDETPGEFHIEFEIKQKGLLAVVSKLENPTQLEEAETLLVALEDAGITYGFDKFIEDIFQKIKNGEDVLQATIAMGTEAEEGQGIYLHELEPPPSESKDYQLGVAKGDCIAELRYHDGKVGYKVTGEEIHATAPIDSIDVFIGDGVEAKMNKYYSTYPGNVKVSKDSIYVQKLVFHKGDYSPKYGPMDSKSNTIIEGNVEKGSVLNIEGDLTIKGALFSNQLNVQGDLKVEVGILGDQENTMLVYGAIRSKYIDQSIVKCEGGLHIEEYIMRSQIITKGNIVCAGSISNSTIYSSKSVSTGALGDDNNNPMKLTVGADFKDLKTLANLERRLANVEAGRKNEESRLEGINEENQAIAERDSKRKKINLGMMSGQTIKETEKSTKEVKKYLEKYDLLIVKINNRIKQVTRKLNYNSNALVMINGPLHRNVSLDVGKKYFCRDSISSCFFNNADSEGQEPKSMADFVAYKGKYSSLIIPGQESQKEKSSEQSQKAS